MMLPLPFGPWPDLSAVSLLAGVVVPHSQQQQPQVRISAMCPHPFTIVPVGRATRWFTEIGITRRLRSTDRDFDARWSIETDDIEFGEALVRLPAARDAVTALGELGGCSIAQGRKHLTVVLDAQERARIKEPERKATVEAQLHLLAGQCGDLLRARHFPRRRGRARLFIGSVLGTVALLVAAIILGVHWSDELVAGETARLALRSLIAGLPIGLAALAAATVPLAGRSTSHKEFGVLSALLLPAVILLCFAGALAANRHLDPGPAVQLSVPVLELHERRDEQKLHGYWAIVPDWRTTAGADGAVDSASSRDSVEVDRGAATRRIAFGTRLGGTIVPGRSRLLLHVSPGRLGAERMLSTVIVTEPQR